MTVGKPPGADGLPCEFYSVFWKEIGETFTCALSFSYETEKNDYITKARNRQTCTQKGC